MYTTPGPWHSHVRPQTQQTKGETMSRKTVTDKADRLKKNYRVILVNPGQALVIGCLLYTSRCV